MPPANDQHGPLTLGQARIVIRTGDVVLFRPERVAPPWRRWLAPRVLLGALVGRLICATGRTEWCHVGMVLDAGLGLVGEMREGTGGGGIRTLEQITERGSIDVVRPSRRPPMDLEIAVAVMRGLINRKYGYAAVARSLLWHTPVARMFCKPPTRDAETISVERPLYCSAAVALALRSGGVDPVANLHDEYTEPGDLGRSLLFRPVCSVKASGEA